MTTQVVLGTIGYQKLISLCMSEHVVHEVVNCMRGNVEPKVQKRKVNKKITDK
jgi:hypothetical protein